MGAYYSKNSSYSRSAGAEDAEDEGRLPLTWAIPEVAHLAKVTRKAARAALLATYDGEWHHVGKYASEVPYYDIKAAALAASPALAAAHEVCVAYRHVYERIAAFAHKLNRWADPVRRERRHDSASRAVATAASILGAQINNMPAGWKRHPRVADHLFRLHAFAHLGACERAIYRRTGTVAIELATRRAA